MKSNFCQKKLCLPAMDARFRILKQYHWRQVRKIFIFNSVFISVDSNLMSFAASTSNCYLSKYQSIILSFSISLSSFASNLQLQCTRSTPTAFISLVFALYYIQSSCITLKRLVFTLNTLKKNRLSLKLQNIGQMNKTEINL